MNTARKFSWLLVAALSLTLAVGGVYAAWLTDSGTVDVQVADKFSSVADATTDQGAFVSYFGDSDTTFGSSGTGVFDPFVRLQADGTESGYNTDGTTEFDTKTGKWTHAILVSHIPQVQCPQGSPSLICFELFNDINESNSSSANASHISLNKVEVYFTDDPNLTGYDFGSAATPEYKFVGDILINDVNQGSGRGDLRYDIPINGPNPIDLASDAPNCDYGNPACDTYFVLYSEWGSTPLSFNGTDYSSDGGFEEWKVKIYPILQVSKDISGAYDTPVTWTIDKKFDATYDLFAGESVTHPYEVSVVPSFGDPENTKVSGTITIVGDDKDDVDASISDLFNGSSADITSCSVPQNEDGTYPIASDATVTCEYELDLLAGPVDGTNVAWASYDQDGVSLAFHGSADILAGDYVETLTGNPDIDVTDTNGEAWSASASSETWTYTRDFSCPVDTSMYTDGFYSFTHKNTATIDQTGQSDDATVTVNCYLLDVTKTADEFYSRTFHWDITKSVSPSSWDLFTGESGTSEYSVNLIQTGHTDNDWQVSGTITIANPNLSRAADLTAVVDDAGTIDGIVSCPSMTVPAGGSLVCSYDTGKQDSPDANPFGDTNTATATQQLYDFDSSGVATADGTKDYSGSAPIAFGAPTELIDEDATVSDTYASSPVSGSYSGDMSWTYSRKFTCDADEGTHDNTASFETNDTQTTDSASASVAVNCYNLSVTKTADEFYTRYFAWQISKDVDPLGPITLAPGESVDLNYSVTVDLLSTTDNDWQVKGSIQVSNAAPIAATINNVGDVASPAIAAAVDCGSIAFPYSLAAGGTLDCTYDTGKQDSANANPFGDTNTATATQQLYDYAPDMTATADGTKDYSGTAPINFSEATISYVDEQIDVNDNYAGFLGTVDALTDTLPKTFNYSRTVTAASDFCGSFQVDNTASFVTNDTGTTGSSDASVVVEVPCEGCTPGFWQGGAGAPLWDVENDEDWKAGNYATEYNPFAHDKLFNDYFSDVTDSRLDGWTMYALVSTGGGSDPAQKAARDMVAAYLNESAFPGSFPADDLASLTQMWYDAVSGGDPALDAFHNTVSAWNSPTDGYCPLP
jgi:hypothetical protein